MPSFISFFTDLKKEVKRAKNNRNMMTVSSISKVIIDLVYSQKRI